MNWTGKQKGEGFEYHLLAIALLLVVMMKGAGALSIDGALSGGETVKSLREGGGFVSLGEGNYLVAVSAFAASALPGRSSRTCGGSARHGRRYPSASACR